MAGHHFLQETTPLCDHAWWPVRRKPVLYVWSGWTPQACGWQDVILAQDESHWIVKGSDPFPSNFRYQFLNAASHQGP
eukprot:1159148-Pelagomonas_calceolata.AAC.7